VCNPCFHDFCLEVSPICSTYLLLDFAQVWKENDIVKELFELGLPFDINPLTAMPGYTKLYVINYKHIFGFFIYIIIWESGSF